MEPYTSVELTRLLDYPNETGPRLAVRRYLRATYLEHVKNAPRELSEPEAADVLGVA
ncbi:hypothetical protein K0817_013940 [Microbacterium sp. HD4P20]|uniref:hypothetical protein n=1 Tax=Microbacterium sp. HD4P20 TaxID=2864874 RepID=UPI001C63F5C0|nr:hypothetical protein [Microbacterium sp. HD4P20]MCP2637656.1 hypothetical protein [Microbacterium sp. HD4P20]